MTYLKFFIFALTLTFSIQLSAQNKTEVDKSVERISKMYNLNDAQKSTYREIVQKKYDALVELKEIVDEPEAYKEGLKKAKDEYDQAFEGVLNDDQKKIFAIQKRMAAGAEADARRNQLNQMQKAPKRANK